MKYSLSILFLILLLPLSCRKDRVIREPIIDYGDPFQIVSLIEIGNNTSTDRTSEILDCKMDDLFFFHGPTEAVLIQSGESVCDGDEETAIGGDWRRSEIMNLDGMLMTIQLSQLYVLHDSLLFGQSELRFMQGYELVKLEENEIIFQNQNDFSTPQTQNVWQLKMSR